MKTAWLRVPAIAIAALLAAACAAAAPTSTPSPTGPTTTGTPAATATPATSASSSASATAGESPTGSAPAESPAESASPTPQPTTFFAGPTTVGEGVTAGALVLLPGRGQRPDPRLKSRAKVINDFNAAHTDIQIQGEFVNYLLGVRHAGDGDRRRQSARHHRSGRIRRRQCLLRPLARPSVR